MLFIIMILNYASYTFRNINIEKLFLETFDVKLNLKLFVRVHIS